MAEPIISYNVANDAALDRTTQYHDVDVFFRSETRTSTGQFYISVYRYHIIIIMIYINIIYICNTCMEITSFRSETRTSAVEWLRKPAT